MAGVLLAAGFAAGALAMEPAAAQPSMSTLNVPPQAGHGSVSDINARRGALFTQMLAQPANIELAFEYAALSSRVGDLEAAISTLERLLIFAPDLARLKLELGALYFRLGSYETARGYFDDLQRVPDLPPEMKDRVKLYLAVINEKTQTSSFHGSVMLGMRYQTNANDGVRGDFAFPPDVSFLELDPSAFAHADTNGFVAGQFHYRYIMPSQGDAFDVNLLTYGSLYSDLHENDTLLGQLTFGPDFDLGRFGLYNSDLSIYGILGGVALDGETYQRSIGAGAKLGKIFDAMNRGELRFEYRYLDYQDSDFRPDASDRTGNRYDMSGYFQHAFNDRFSVFASVDAARHVAVVDFQTFWEVGGSIGLSYAFDSPIASLPGRWITTVSGGALRRVFDGPDTSLGLFDVREKDVETFVYGNLTVPLADKWALQTGISYRNVDSNYDIYSFDSVGVSIAIAKRF
ncbi:MAG: tetratricopeptide repeat protein [Rhizobiaceae bacterium]